MRPKINIQIPLGFSNFSAKKRNELEFFRKYARMSEHLDGCPKILDVFHADLEASESKSIRTCQYSSENILRMLIIMFIERLSFREVCLRVSDSILLRDFVRLGVLEVPEHTLLCKAKNCITEKTWNTINNMLFQYAKETSLVSCSHLRIDSTAVESNIHYPTDASLLWDSYRVLERLIKKHNDSHSTLDRINIRFRTEKVKKIVQSISRLGRSKSESSKNNKRLLTIQILDRVDSICQAVIRQVIASGNKFDSEHFRYSKLAEKVVWQARERIVNNRKIPNSEKLFSIFEEHTQLLIRGKSGKPIEFGHKVTIAQTKEKFISYYDVDNKSFPEYLHLDLAIKNHFDQFGSYPSIVAADQGYWENEEQYAKWKENIEVVGIPKRGKLNSEQTKRQSSSLFKLSQRFRCGVEGTIGVLKACFKMKRALWKGIAGFKNWIGGSVFAHNLVLLARL